MKITFLRHGKTKGNLTHQFIGKTDQPLCEEGRQELICAKDQGRYPLADVILTSPMQRCLQTVNILYPGQTFEIVDGLRETDFGDFEGKTHHDLENNPIYQEFLTQNGKMGFPHGETLEGARLRMCSAWEVSLSKLLRQDIQSAVVVVHGGTILNLFSAYGVPQRAYYDWQCDNGDGWVSSVTPETWNRQQMMILYKLSHQEE